MYQNRFGFSTKKPDQHRPANPQLGTASVKRVPSFGGRPNAEFTPSFGATATNKPSFGGFGQEASSLRKLSAGKNFNHGARASGIASTIKQTGRAMPAASMGFCSTRKSSVNSKLFGVTPQHSRASYMQQQNRASTSRLSRSSMSGRGGKDNRPLSDQAFHRECIDKILEFLTIHDYPHQFTKQTLLRPSSSDVSHIFEYLFSFYQPGIVIKNGANTSLDVVVPKMLAELGYPFQLKRSDLVSCSGGRQLGAVLESICFVIGVISYIDNVDISQFQKDLDSDDFGTTNIAALLADIAEQTESDEIDPQTDQRLTELAENFFGTEKQILQKQAEVADLDKNLKCLEDEIAIHVELPNKIQTCKEEVAVCEKYLSDITDKEDEYKKMARELFEEIQTKEAILQRAQREEAELQAQVDSQKEIIMRYRLAIERKSQICEEIEKEKQQIQLLDEQILSTTLEETKQKATNSSFISDLNDIISSFFDSVKSSKINQISPAFAKAFEEDPEWRAIYDQFKGFKDWDIKSVDDALIQRVKDFGHKFQNKFKDFKRTILEQKCSLKGSASIDLICKKQEVKALHEKKRQQLAESESELADFIAKKESHEKEEADKLSSLQTGIDSAKKEIIESNKNNSLIEKELYQTEQTNNLLAKLIKEKREGFMKQMLKNMESCKKFYDVAQMKHETLVQRMHKNVAKHENKLSILVEYEKKLNNN